jgi:hypothetical protein
MKLPRCGIGLVCGDAARKGERLTAQRRPSQTACFADHDVHKARKTGWFFMGACRRKPAGIGQSDALAFFCATQTCDGTLFFGMPRAVIFSTSL